MDEGDEEERVVSSSVGDEERVVSSSFGEEQVEREEVRLGDEIVEAEEEGEREWIGEEVVPGSESPEERRVKRRKVSVDETMTSSPAPEASSAALSEAEAGSQAEETALGIWSGSEEEDIDPTGRDVAALQQPTFRAAPRFKPTEGDPAAEGILPAAFSPQRRGAKYLPNGLAAELQGWLSDVKRWDEDGSTGPGKEKFQVLVREVSEGGRRMYLVRGAGEEERYVLAGEGRLTGLGRRAVVREGSIVEVEGPVWEVELEGGRWTVCCEWWVA